MRPIPVSGPTCTLLSQFYDFILCIENHNSQFEKNPRPINSVTILHHLLILQFFQFHHLPNPTENQPELEDQRHEGGIVLHFACHLSIYLLE